MTIGDVLAIIALIVATTAAWGAMILFAGLLFPARTESAERCLIEHPWACLLRGVAITTVLTALAIALASGGAGPFRLLAGVAVGYGGLLSAIGSAAVVRLIASRLRTSEAVEPNATASIPYALLLKSTVIYTLSGLLPIVGWLFVAPIFLLVSIGAGSGAFIGAKKAAAFQAPTPSMEMGL